MENPGDSCPHARHPHPPLAVLTTESIDGVPIVFREDGYINVTKIAQSYGKRAIDFLRLPGTDEYMVALEEAISLNGGIFPPLAPTEVPGTGRLVCVKKGRYGGTWLHPKMAVALMRWLDVPFSVRADLLIDNILRGNITTTVSVPTLEAIRLGGAAKVIPQVLVKELLHFPSGQVIVRRFLAM